jgi:hypothetical protein
MIKKLLTLLLTVCVCISCQGCTYKNWYEAFHEVQRTNCYTIENSNGREECLERVNRMTYEEYEKAREDLNKKVE